jgi:hypothetical protein
MGSRITALRYARRLSAAEAPVVTGSTNVNLARDLLRQTIEAMALPAVLTRRAVRERVAAAKAAMAGLTPQNPVEGVIGTQMIATHGAAMACLARAMDEKTAEDVAQAALRRAERLLAVYARQCDTLMRIRHARAIAAAGAAANAALPYDAPPWMTLLAPEAVAWLQAQAAAKQLPAPAGRRAPADEGAPEAAA